MKLDNIKSSIINELIEKIDNTSPVDTKAEITDEEILTLIKAARLAPSADNSQIWRFLIIKGSEKIREALSYTMQREREFNVLIVALAAPFIIKHIRREQPFYAIDVPIAISHIILQGRELGIRTELIFIFENKEIMEFLKIPNKYKPVALLGLNKYAS